MSTSRAKRARGGGPTFLDNVCLHLASSLLRPTVVTDHLRSLSSPSTQVNEEGQEVLKKESQLYWRSQLLTDLDVLQCQTSPLVSTDAQSRVVYIDCTISFLPPSTASDISNNTDSSIGDNSSSNTAVQPSKVSPPRVRAKFGALLRSWNAITVHPQTGVIDRSCRPNGGMYVQQSHYVTRRGLREYGNGISIDLDSMESRPTARLIGTALRGDGLSAEVIGNKDNGGDGNGRVKGEKGGKRVMVMLEHSNLGETGSFAIAGDPSGDMVNNTDGHIGELAMKMILANLQATVTSQPIDTSASTTAALAGTIAFDPEKENELRKVFEDWWGRASGGDDTTTGDADAIIAASLPNNDKLPSSDAIAPVSDGLAAKTVAATDIAEVTALPPTNDIDRSTEEKPSGSSSSAPAAEDQTEPRPTGSAKENQKQNASLSALNEHKSSDAAVETPPQQTKRKAPGPILVRAGGGVGGGRKKKKKKGKITIGKA